MSTSIFPTVIEAQANTKKADFEFICGHEIYQCFKAVIEASSLGQEGVSVEVLPLYQPNCQAALTSKGYLVTPVSIGLIQIEWAPHLLRRAAFKLISLPANKNSGFLPVGE